MKQNLRKLFLALGVMFSHPSYAMHEILESGKGVGSGGGGVIRDGEYLTFTKAGYFKIKMTPFKEGDQGYDHFKKSLNLINLTLSKMPLESELRGNLRMAFTPIGNRQYFRVDQYDEIQIKKIREAYAKSYGLNSRDLVVYAVTNGANTYLLPDFFKLNELDAASVILYESLQSKFADTFVFYEIDHGRIDVKIENNDILKAVLSFERFITENYKNYPHEFFFQFSFFYLKPAISLKAAAQWDSQQNLPIETINAEANTCKSSYKKTNSPQDLCARKVYQLLKKYPHSQWLQERLRFSTVLDIQNMSNSGTPINGDLNRRILWGKL